MLPFAVVLRYWLSCASGIPVVFSFMIVFAVSTSTHPQAMNDFSNIDGDRIPTSSADSAGTCRRGFSIQEKEGGGWREGRRTGHVRGQ